MKPYNQLQHKETSTRAIMSELDCEYKVMTLELQNTVNLKQFGSLFAFK